MKPLADKILLLLYCLGTCMFFQPDIAFVAFFFLAVSVSAFSYALSDLKCRFLFLVFYGCGTVFFPVGICFFPLLLYDLMSFSSFTLRAIGLFFPWAALFLLHSKSLTPALTFYLVLGMVFSSVLYLRTQAYLQLARLYRNVRDEQMERNLLLKEKNRTLLEKQNYEIYAATLKERNRIAREIHDHVGHMLSRSILMVGAIKAVSKDACIQLPLEQLGDTLNAAMNNIRESVHDLHDESVNLKETVNGLLADFHYCHVSLEYDMGYELPVPVKYCFLSIIKEGLSNIARHSQASQAQITLREHPGMYQLIIRDNGTGAQHLERKEGIGLLNMEERVRSLQGTIRFDTCQGFRIFIIIPKEKSEKGERRL